MIWQPRGRTSGAISVDDPSLQHPIHDHGYADRALLSVGLGYIHSSDRTGPPGLRLAVYPAHQFRFLPGGGDDLTVDARRQASSVDLLHPPHADQRVSEASEHELLHVSDPVYVPFPR